MTLSLTAQIGGALFVSRPIGASAFEYGIGTDGITGWGPDVEFTHDTVKIPDAPGSYDVPVVAGDRVIEISGTAIARTPRDLVEAADLFAALLADAQPDTLTITREGKATWSSVKRTATWQWTDQRSRRRPRATFQAQFWARDPRRYGETRTVAAAAGTAFTVFHRGTFSATPIFTVSGAAPSYTIAGPSGKQYAVTQALATGHPHTIDMLTGLLTVDGAPVYGKTSRADVWAIPAGQQVSHTVTVPSGNATVTAAVLDTYI